MFQPHAEDVQSLKLSHKPSRNEIELVFNRYKNDAIFEIPTTSYGGAGIAMYDQRWRRRFDDGVALERDGRALGTLALECRRFPR